MNVTVGDLLDGAHCECLDRVLQSTPVTAELLRTCLHCFESNPALKAHVEEQIAKNASQQEIATRLKQAAYANPYYTQTNDQQLS